MDLIGYVVVSPAEALADPVGFDGSGITGPAQREAIEREVARRGERLTALIQEQDITSLDAVEERVGLGEALELLVGGGRLLVARLDRLAADVAIQELLLADLRRMGADVVSAAEADTDLLADPPADPVRAAIRHAVRTTPQVQGALRSLHARLNMRRVADTADASAMAGMDHIGEGGMMLDDLARVLREQRLRRGRRAGAARGWPRWWSPTGRGAAGPS